LRTRLKTVVVGIKTASQGNSSCQRCTASSIMGLCLFVCEDVWETSDDVCGAAIEDETSWFLRRHRHTHELDSKYLSASRLDSTPCRSSRRVTASDHTLVSPRERRGELVVRIFTVTSALVYISLWRWNYSLKDNRQSCTWRVGLAPNYCRASTYCTSLRQDRTRVMHNAQCCKCSRDFGRWRMARF
jgi:hypothetical protein